MSEGQQSSACVLEYRRRGVDYATRADTQVVLLALMQEANVLRFLVNPELESIVHAADLAYIQPLLKDFLERAEYEPRDLFKQLSSLGVGPLVTRSVLTGPSAYESLSDLIQEFIPL